MIRAALREWSDMAFCHTPAKTIPGGGSSNHRIPGEFPDWKESHCG